MSPRRHIREAIEELLTLEPWLGRGPVERWRLIVRTGEGWTEITGDANDAELGIVASVDFENEYDDAVAAIEAAGR